MSDLIQVGVTKAIKAFDLENTDTDARRIWLDSVVLAASDELKMIVKGARPRSDFDVRMDGPTDDPIQGRIYQMTIWASFRPTDLDADSIAAQTYRKDGTR